MGGEKHAQGTWKERRWWQVPPVRYYRSVCQGKYGQEEPQDNRFGAADAPEEGKVAPATLVEGSCSALPLGLVEHAGPKHPGGVRGGGDETMTSEQWLALIALVAAVAGLIEAYRRVRVAFA